MMLIQCFGRKILEIRRAGQFAHDMTLSNALLAVLVDHVAPSLDACGFRRIAQLVLPCDALLAALVDHVAPSLDERSFGHVAIPHTACAPVAS